MNAGVYFNSRESCGNIISTASVAFLPRVSSTPYRIVCPLLNSSISSLQPRVGLRLFLLSGIHSNTFCGRLLSFNLLACPSRISCFRSFVPSVFSMPVLCQMNLFLTCRGSFTPNNNSFQWITTVRFS